MKCSVIKCLQSLNPTFHKFYKYISINLHLNIEGSEKSCKVDLNPNFWIHLGSKHVFPHLWSKIYLPGGSDGKETASNMGDPGLIPESGNSPGEGNGNPFQYSCLENPTDPGLITHRISISWITQFGGTLIWNTYFNCLYLDCQVISRIVSVGRRKSSIHKAFVFMKRSLE